MFILLFGPQGSGKGTQGERLAERYHLPLIGMGDLLRGEAKKDTERGRLAAETMSKGELVPERITDAVLFDRLAEPDAENGFILDGYPRDERQDKALQTFLAALRGGTKITRAVFFDLPEAEAIERLSGRRVCAACGKIFHIKHSPPKREGICNACGGKVVQREDDKPDAIKKRLAIYEQETAPLLANYEKGGALVRVAARGSIDEVHNRVIKAIEREDRIPSPIRGEG